MVRVKANNKIKIKKKIINLVQIKIQFKCKSFISGIQRKTKIKLKKISKISNKFRASNFNKKIMNKNNQKMLLKKMQIIILNKVNKIKIIINKIRIIQIHKMNIHQDQFLRMNKI